MSFSQSFSAVAPVLKIWMLTRVFFEFRGFQNRGRTPATLEEIEIFIFLNPECLSILLGRL